MSSDSVADVVVIGAGVAGLSAAIEAALRGAHVIVFEAAPTIGGASAMSGAACCLVGTPLQESKGIVDSVELALADWTSTGGPTADLAWARQYLENSRTEVHDWLEALGIEWLELGLTEGNSVPRWHVPAGWGPAIVDALIGRCTELSVQIDVDSPVIDLDVADRSVRAVVVRSSGVERRFAVSKVIVCAGGFVANHDMVLERAPHLRTLPRVLSGGSPGALGAGHALLAKVGVEFVNLDHIWVYPNGTPDPSDATGARGVGVRGVLGDIWLNKDGLRFHDETIRGGRSGTVALVAQPDQTAWSIFNGNEQETILLIDNEYYGSPRGANPEAMKEFWRDSAYAWRGDTPAELAAAIGLPVEAVQQAISRFNSDVEAGIDTAFGRDIGAIEPLVGPGLVALQFFPMAQKNFGGVHTDLDCRVLAAAGGPIQGLYAAGEVAGMAGGAINGRAALEGTMFGPCLYSGRIAGATAGAELAGLVHVTV